MTSTETRRRKPSDASTLAPIEWYRDPELDGPTPVTVTADGRIFGHVATWQTSHVSFPGRNVKPPRSRADYAYFHSGGALVSDGGTPTEISVGVLTLDTNHASITSDAVEAERHYSDTGTMVATVCAGEDDYGIWYSGAIAPEVDELRMHRLRASAISGDWRVIDNSLELVAALCVCSGGFPIPRARVASASDLVPIVAAGMVAPRPDPQETPMPDTDTPESLTAASPNPFAKGEPAPPSGDDSDEGGSGFDSGDTVTIGDTDMVGQVVTSADDGSIVVELTVPADLLEHADDEDAMAASARFTDRMADRKRDADISKLTAALSTVTAALEASQETTAARDAKLDELLAKQRSADFDRIVASADVAGVDA